jgi:hypothetical protein
MAKSGAASKLRRWCDQNGINFSEGARRIGTVPDTFRRYAQGMRLPRPPHMVAIYTLTGGEVTPNDFYDLPPLPPVDAQEAA